MSEPHDYQAWVIRAEEDYALCRSALRRKAPLLYGATFYYTSTLLQPGSLSLTPGELIDNKKPMSLNLFRWASIAGLRCIAVNHGLTPRGRYWTAH